MKKLIALLLTLAFILSLSCTALAENKLEKILSIGEITFATSPDFAPSEFINPNATATISTSARTLSWPSTSPRVWA